MDGFSKRQRVIANYILSNYDKAAYMTASRLGKAISVSESTVVRFAAELGYEGYPEMQRALQELERQGLLFSLRTSGRFVTEDKAMIEEAKGTLARERITAILQQMEALGYERREIISLLEHTEGGEIHDTNS